MRSVRVYPHGRTLDAAVDLAVPRQALDAVGDGELGCWKAPPWPGRSACSGGTGSRNRCGRGFGTLWCRDLPVAPEAPLWEEACGALTQITASLVLDGRTVSRARADFGLRTFGADGGRLTLNGRVFLLRGEANCCVFPETGHPPMTTGAWREVLVATGPTGSTVCGSIPGARPRRPLRRLMNWECCSSPNCPTGTAPTRWKPRTAPHIMRRNCGRSSSATPTTPPLSCSRWATNSAPARRTPPDGRAGPAGPAAGPHQTVCRVLQRPVRGNRDMTASSDFYTAAAYGTGCSAPQAPR